MLRLLQAAFVSLCFLPSARALQEQPMIPLDFVKAIGAEGDSLGQFHNPTSLTVDPSGNLYVADTGNNRIQKFNSEGVFQRYIGGIGSGAEQFDSPMDVNAWDGLNVHVADFNNHRIHRLDNKLNAISIFSGNSEQNFNLQFSFPQSVTVTAEGDLFVLEGENNSVLKLNPFFTLVAQFGSIETGEGYLGSPAQIEIFGRDLLAVSDVQAGHLAIFDYFGNFVRFLGDDKLSRPTGLFFWSDRNLLLVSDPGSGEIHAFTEFGWSSELRILSKTEESAWKSPADLAVFKDRLYVLDQEQSTILVYKILAAPE